MSDVTLQQALVDLDILEGLTVMVDGHGGGDYGERIREHWGEEIDNIRAALTQLQERVTHLEKGAIEQIEQAHMAGQSNAGVDPSYSEAKLYVESRK